MFAFFLANTAYIINICYIYVALTKIVNKCKRCHAILKILIFLNHTLKNAVNKYMIIPEIHGCSVKKNLFRKFPGTTVYNKKVHVCSGN